MDPIKKKVLDEIKAFCGLDKLVFLDFETFWKSKANNGTKSYTLNKTPYWDYINSPRFQVTGLGYAIDDGEWTYVHNPGEVMEAVESIRNLRDQGQKLGLVAHNCQFDGSILNWRGGVNFDWYFCTMLVEKLLNVHESSSLKKTAERRWPDDESMRKGDELLNTDGVRYEDFTDADHVMMEKYCVQDNHLMREIFIQQLAGGLPKGEIEAINITLRGAIERQFCIDRTPLREVIEESEAEKAVAVSEAIKWCHSQGVEEVSPASLSSDQKYAALLARFGMKVPLKMSETTFLMIPALGQNDPEYTKFQINNPVAAPLFKARRLAKSNIAKTRAEKMILVADKFRDLPQYVEGGPDMPMFLKYYGAENTGRWSGGELLNQQNLQRNSKHRLSMMAQEDHVIGVNDLSNIELRVNLWFCEQEDLLSRYQDDAHFDMYSDLASDIYGFQVDKKVHKDERQIGKAGSLGLGYAMSWPGFQRYLAGGPLGMEPLFVEDAFAKNVKSAYDAKHYAIAAMWSLIANQVLPTMAGGGGMEFGRDGCVRAVKDKLILPSGRALHYPNCRAHGEETKFGYRVSYVCDSSRRDRFGKPLVRSLHKGLIIENIIQAMARDILAWQMVRVERELKAKNLGWVIGSVHDEILSMLKESSAQAGFEIMQNNMSLKPDWAHGMPLASEGGYAKEYSK